MKSKPKDSTGVKVDASKLSFNDNQYLIMADEIEASLHIGDSWSPYEDDAAIGDVLMNLKNDDDWYKLIQVYGLRETTPLTELNLVSTLQQYLDTDVVDAVNQDWMNKNMIVRI